VGETNRFVTPVSSIFAAPADEARVRLSPTVAGSALGRGANVLTIVIALLARTNPSLDVLSRPHQRTGVTDHRKGLCQLGR
jgi:hypothetical protein